MSASSNTHMGNTGRNDEGRRAERREQRQPASTSQGLVAVPDRRDGIHHHVAGFGVRLEAEQHAHAEVEASRMT